MDWISRSIGSVTNFSTSREVAPGYWVISTACLMTNGASSFLGNLKKEMIPPISIIAKKK